MADEDSRVAAVVQALEQSRKYASICPDALRRVATWSLLRHRSEKDALKAAKRKLHQVYAAYLDVRSLSAAETLLDALPPDASEEHVTSTAAAILRLHASSAERLPVITEFYRSIFAVTGPATSVLDLACGLNPFALPWMDLSRASRYVPVDLDTRMVALINRFLSRLGRPQSAVCADILTGVPEEKVDVALLLKAVPCLEQQEEDAALGILNRLPAKWAVVSFPTKSLGGRPKGMARTYASVMASILERLGRHAEEFTMSNECVYVVRLG